ncbi:MAG: FAD-dependent oxidoreductase [Gemmatimonadota bacterium]|nr:FAD-dependent oxidoreductase [Gemmatimonadota bacterium]
MHQPSAGSARTHVVVVGGGVIGVCSAYYLARAGARVTLLERGAVAAEASAGNAGTISPGHPPLNRPGRVRQGLRGMFDPASPVHVPPRWDPGLWRWLLEFAENCTREQLVAATDVMAPLGHRSLELFEAAVAEEGLACGYRADGYYDVCASAAALAVASDEADLIRPHGYRPEVLAIEELRRHEPALAPTFAGGVFYPEAATVDPYAFVTGLAEAARRLGVCIVEGAEVTDLVVEGGALVGARRGDGTVVPADAALLATGPFALELAGRFGTRLPVRPGKGYHRDLPVGLDDTPPLRIACVLHESAVFCTPLAGRVRLAGTMEFAGVDRELRPERLAQLSRAAGEAFPALAGRPSVSEWCGLRPMSADGLPLVGPLPGLEDVWVATGHGMLGLTLGPVTGELVADGLLGGAPSPHLLALGPERFHDGR